MLWWSKNNIIFAETMDLSRFKLRITTEPDMGRQKPDA